MTAPTFTPLAERDEELCRRANDGDVNARARLVERHLGLVHSVAHRYRNLGLPYEDLVQEGAIGLLDAIERFDPGRRAAFATYAYWRIRQAITHAITSEGHVVRLPKQIIERRRRIAAAAAALANEGRDHSLSGVARATGLQRDSVQEALAAPFNVTSLDEPYEDGTPLEGRIADEAVRDPALEALENVEADRLGAALEQLSSRKRHVVMHHFGIGQAPETLADVGAALHVSAQRARALEREALCELGELLADDVARPFVSRAGAARRRRRDACEVRTCVKGA
jgi:RNA polymerase primary sigma factor